MSKLKTGEVSVHPLFNWGGLWPQKTKNLVVAAALSTGISAFAGSSGVAFCQDGSLATSGVIAQDLFQFPPQSAEELIAAARTTQRLDRPDDARAFLQQVLDLQLSDSDWTVVRKVVGPGELMALRQDPRLLPEAEQVLQLANKAAMAVPHTPDELRAWVQQLGQGGFAATNAAKELLSSAGEAPVFLLEAAPSTPEGRVAQQLLEEHIGSFQSALAKQLRDPGTNKADRIRILGLLGQSGDASLADRLLRWQFDPDAEIARAASRAIQRLSQSQMSFQSSWQASEYLSDKAEQYLVDASKRFSGLYPTPAMIALKAADPRSQRIEDASGFLVDAIALSPDNARGVELALVAELAKSGGSMSLPSTAPQDLSQQQLLETLRTSLEVGNSSAAIELLKSLQGLVLKPAVFTEAESILRMALQSDDVRVRFLASKISGDQPDLDVSSSTISFCLTAVKEGSTRPEAVVITGENKMLDDLQFTLEASGYKVVAAETGPDGFAAAASQMNCELLLLSAEAPVWPIAVTLANLRADVRTRSIPVVVFGPRRFESKVMELAKIYPGVWFVSEPIGVDTKIETRSDPLSFARVRSVESVLRLQLGSINLPPNVLTPSDRAAMKVLLY